MELNFQMDENIPSFNERLKISQRGVERKDLRLKRKVPGRPFGPKKDLPEIFLSIKKKYLVD
jgi:hypothetical protein